MGGGDLNLKKSWHPSTMKNMEKVWKAEQQDHQEKKRIAELKREIEMEKDKEDMTKFAMDQGVIEKKDDKKLDWMYKGPNQMVSRDDYLLGKPIDKQFEQMAQAEKEAEKMNRAPKNHVEYECIPPSLRFFSGSEPVDLLRKQQEDPLYAIKKKEMETKSQLLKNPVRLKQLRDMLEQQSKENHVKKSKKQKRKKRSRSNSNEQDSDNDLNTLLAKKFRKLKKEMDEDVLIKSMKKIKKEKKRKKKRARESSSSSSSSSSTDSESSESEKEEKRRRKDKRSGNYEEHESRRKECKKKRHDESDRRQDRSDNRDNRPDRHENEDRWADRRPEGPPERFIHDSWNARGSYDNRRQIPSQRPPDFSRNNRGFDDNRRQSLPRRPADFVRNARGSNESRRQNSQRRSVDSFKNSRGSAEGRRQTSPKRFSDSFRDRRGFENGERARYSQKVDYGLMRADRTRVETPPRFETSRPVKPPVRETKKEEKRWVAPKRQTLTEEEKDKRRREMMANASWRDKEREFNVKRYREQEKKEQPDKSYNKDFLRKQLAVAAESSTVGSRIRSNINNIQRSGRTMDTNFAKR